MGIQRQIAFRKEESKVNETPLLEPSYFYGVKTQNC